MDSKFPNVKMIADGELRRAVAQTPNYTSHEDGRPTTFGEMMAQGVGEQTVHGLEEVDWESPMYRGLMPKLPNNSVPRPLGFRDGTSASQADEGFGSLPASPMPNKVAW